MTAPKPFPPAKLICGIIAGREEVFEASRKALGAAFGPIDAESPRFNFALTDYYCRETGPDLERMFVSFKDLIAPDTLSEVKLRTNALETGIGHEFPGPARPANLDPGILTGAALIMATAKDFSHRVPLQKGIYAHLELLFEKGGVRLLPWTYPDFRDGRYNDFLLKARASYLDQLKP